MHSGSGTATTVIAANTWEPNKDGPKTKAAERQLIK
jgi:hypothetical protein